jgi:hypothetical protein
MAMIEMEVPMVIPQEFLMAFSEDMVVSLLEDVANAARLHWINLANRYLHTSRNDYVTSIQDVQIIPGMATITLVGQPANIIENGLEEVDLREWLLGPNVPVAPFGEKGKRQAADGGFYRAIPFRHQVPGSSGTVARAMGDPYRGVVAGARDLGKEVYAAAKKLRKRKAKIGPPRMVQGRLPAGMFPKLKEHHKTDIYAGMIRSRAAYKKVVQAQYVTFRTISTNVSTGWIRPPTGGRHFAQRTSKHIQRMAPMKLQAYLKGIQDAQK